ncbi:excalibur calcium-binding domain-containing protein [Sphingopyxis bauzanensis]|uniref:excalibur calcium-binding domain-containing protein n=1 Tax=Sphingopyxis bauzanensis TaxID=651663 RepID=UPI001E5E2FF7|nr:excalibur calcium-binding domain-containing protein [Sphingopyxis bauzanensis]
MAICRTGFGRTIGPPIAGLISPSRRHPAVRRPIASPAPSGVYYNYNAALAAGTAPLCRGQPGYRPEMDGDGDGGRAYHFGCTERSG